jgi:hypothetical protein
MEPKLFSNDKIKQYNNLYEPIVKKLQQFADKIYFMNKHFNEGNFSVPIYNFPIGFRNSSEISKYSTLSLRLMKNEQYINRKKVHLCLMCFSRYDDNRDKLRYECYEYFKNKTYVFDLNKFTVKSE